MPAGRPPKHIQQLTDDLGQVLEAQTEAEKNISLFESPLEFWKSQYRALQELAGKIDRAISRAWVDHYQLSPAT